MGIQMTIPFTVLQNGAVSVETDENIQISQRVTAIVGTEIGQRPMRATLGLPLSRLIFGLSNNLITAELRDQVTTQLHNYEPGVTVNSVVPKPHKSGDGIAEIQVNYAPVLAASAAAATTDTAIIKVGGTVQEVTLNGNR